VGKTRLAVECAARLTDTMPHGAWLSELGPLADPDEVPGAILAALGLGGGTLLTGSGPGTGGRDVNPTDRLVAALASREALLVLDNCEHLVDAAAGLAATGDLVSARAKYEAALRELDQRPKPFQPIKAVALVGLALVTLAEGNPAGVVDLLGTALRTAAESGSAPGIATVLEATAALVLADATSGGDNSAGGLTDRAERAATLLGAAHGVRGGADPRHPDVARATAGALNALGQAGFDDCYARGLGLSRADAIGLTSAYLGRGQAATP
jgi:hypothetical protein